MIFGLIGVATSILLGYFVVALLWPDNLSRWFPLYFSPAVGLGLSSLILVVFRRPLFVVEILLLLVTGTLWFVRKRSTLAQLKSLVGWRPHPLYLLLWCAIGMGLSYWIVRVERSPHGDWDATAIWNSHARYLYRDGPSWQKTIRNTAHPDYPLLVPAATARIWRYMGREIPDTAGGLGMLFTLSGIAILAATLRELRTPGRAVLFGLILLGTPFYMDYGVSGSADVPLSMYILATIALICLRSNVAPSDRGLMILAGFTAGCAGWTKNEGLLFIAIVSAALLVPVLWKPRETVFAYFDFLTGLALPIAVIAWFKISVAPPNDIISGNSMAQVSHKLLDPERYLTVWRQFSEIFWSFGNWIVNPFLLVLAYVGVQRIDRKMLLNAAWLQGACICAMMVAGYAAIYIVSPMDLEWHLQSSLPRLYLQVWPLFLLLAGLIASGSADTAY